MGNGPASILKLAMALMGVTLLSLAAPAQAGEGARDSIGRQS